MKVSAMMIAMIFAVAFASCGNKGSNDEVSKFISVIDNTTKQLKSADGDFTQIQQIGQDADNEMKQFEGSAVALTAADYDAISEAMFEMTKVTMESFGMEFPVSYNDIKGELISKMEQYKTLGELTDAIMSGAFN